MLKSRHDSIKIEKLKEKTLRPLIRVIPLSFIRRCVPCRIIIVYYHIVTDDDISHVKHLYRNKNIAQFIDDLEFLLKYYVPTDLLEVIKNIKNGTRDTRHRFLLTFDDGFREIYDVIAPILLQKGVPATFFNSSSFLDNRELCYQHKASILVEEIKKRLSSGAESEIKNIMMNIGLSYSQLFEGVLLIDYSKREALDRIADVLQVDFQRYLTEKLPYLTSAQVKDLINKGFTIGAHSIDHPYYSALTLEAQLEQTLESVKKIRDTFSLDYGAFAFPHNDNGVSLEFFEKVKESGMVDVTFGTGGMVESEYQNHKQRISMEKPLLCARALLKWQYARRLYRKL